MSASDPSPKPAAGGRELHLRIASAVVIGPVALFLAWAGGTSFLGLATVAAVVMASEWTTITLGRSFAPIRLGLLLLVGLTTVGYGLVGLAGLPFLVALAVAAIGIGLAWMVIRHEARNREASPQAAGWAPIGAVYSILPPVALVALRDGETGIAVIVFLFAVVWGTDIAAYFTGRAIGGPKLWPAVSPKKTWSGGLGGLVAAVLAGTLVAMIVGAPRLMPVAAVGAVLSVASQAGDFFESALKRRFGVKDSGWIIPGHGGLLDRVDGLVAAAVVAFALVAIRGAGDPAALLFW